MEQHQQKENRKVIIILLIVLFFSYIENKMLVNVFIASIYFCLRFIVSIHSNYLLFSM